MNSPDRRPTPEAPASSQASLPSSPAPVRRHEGPTDTEVRRAALIDELEELAVNEGELAGPALAILQYKFAFKEGSLGYGSVALNGADLVSSLVKSIPETCTAVMDMKCEKTRVFYLDAVRTYLRLAHAVVDDVLNTIDSED